MILEKGNFTISSERNHVDIDTLHDMLSRSYWAKDRSREDVEKSVENSLCFSLLIILCHVVYATLGLMVLLKSVLDFLKNPLCCLGRIAGIPYGAADDQMV